MAASCSSSDRPFQTVIVIPPEALQCVAEASQAWLSALLLDLPDRAGRKSDTESGQFSKHNTLCRLLIQKNYKKETI